MANELIVIEKAGEITGKPMFQVRGDPHWHSTPQIAKKVHLALQRANASGFFTTRKDNKK